MLLVFLVVSLFSLQEGSLYYPLKTYSYSTVWSPSVQLEFLDAIQNDGIFYWEMPKSHENLYEKAYENSIEFFKMTNEEWVNGGEFIKLNNNNSNECLNINEYWNMSYYQTLQKMNTDEIELFFYGYNDYRNSYPPSYIKHFVLPMHNTNILFNNYYHPFNESVILYCNELVKLALYVLNKAFVSLNITNDLKIYNDLLGNNPVKSCAIAYYHYPNMYKNQNNSNLGDGFAPHKDIGLIAVVKQDSSGLELLTSPQNNSWYNENETFVGYNYNNDNILKSSNIKWTPVKYDSTKYLINFSALFEYFTKNKIKAPIHKVRKIDKERMTFALFLDPDYHNGNVYQFNTNGNNTKLVKKKSMRTYLKQSVKQIFDINI